MCSIQAGHGESRAAFQAPWTEGKQKERLVSAWGCARELLPAWAAFQRGPMERDGCRVWSQLLFGCVVMGSGPPPCPQCPAARQAVPGCLHRQREGTSSPTDLAGQPGLVPLCWKRLSPRSPAEGTRGAGPRAVPPHRMSPEPLSWPAPPPGLFPRPENNTSPSIQETFIT